MACAMEDSSDMNDPTDPYDPLNFLRTGPDVSHVVFCQAHLPVDFVSEEKAYDSLVLSPVQIPSPQIPTAARTT